MGQLLVQQLEWLCQLWEILSEALIVGAIVGGISGSAVVGRAGAGAVGALVALDMITLMAMDIFKGV